MTMLFLDVIISVAHETSSFVFLFFVLFFFLPSLHCILLGCGLPIHFVARSVLTDLGGAAGLTERSREINLRLF